MAQVPDRGTPPFSSWLPVPSFSSGGSDGRADGHGLFAFHEARSWSDQRPPSQGGEPVQGKWQDPWFSGSTVLDQLDSAAP